jgi:hypothetical protein
MTGLVEKEYKCIVVRKQKEKKVYVIPYFNGKIYEEIPIYDENNAINQNEQYNKLKDDTFILSKIQFLDGTLPVDINDAYARNNFEDIFFNVKSIKDIHLNGMEYLTVEDLLESSNFSNNISPVFEIDEFFINETF